MLHGFGSPASMLHQCDTIRRGAAFVVGMTLAA